MSALTFLLEGKILSKIALIGFLLTLPLSVRKVLLLLSPAANGTFNEYTDISLYLSDLALLVFLFCIILENKNIILSIKWWKQLFHVEQSGNPVLELSNVPRGTFLNNLWLTIKKCSTWNISIFLIAVPLPFLVWTAISIFWSESQMLAFYATVKLFEGYFLYVGIIVLNVPRGTILTKYVRSAKCSTWNNSNQVCPECQMFHVEQLRESKFGISNVPRGTFFGTIFRIMQECSTWNILSLIFKVLILSGFIQSSIAISQFISQSSLGMRFLKESEFTAEQAGIAKIVYLDMAFVRSYGLFPHPNILAAFLGITIFMTMGYQLVFGRKLFHVEQSGNQALELPNVPRGTFLSTLDKILQKCSTWNISAYARSIVGKMFHVEHFGLWYGLTLGTQVFGFLLTFSKSAFIGAFLAISYLVYRVFHVEQLGKSEFETLIVPRGTILSRSLSILKKCSTWNIRSLYQNNTQKMFHVEHCLIVVGMGIVLIALVIFSRGLNWYYFFWQPLNERIYLYRSLFLIFDQHFWLGVGVGQLVFTLQDFFVEKLNVWQFQPIHNLYLLIMAEVGMVGLSLFLCFVLTVIIVPRGTIFERILLFIKKCSTWNIGNQNGSNTKKVFHVEQFLESRISKVKGWFFESLLVFVLITGFFDHYYWDIQQGQLLLWLVLGLLASQRVMQGIDK